MGSTLGHSLFIVWAPLVAQMVKNSPAMQEILVQSWPGRTPGEGNGSPLHYSCLENPTDRGAWRATVHGITKSWDTTELFTVHSYLLFDYIMMPF